MSSSVVVELIVVLKLPSDPERASRREGVGGAPRVVDAWPGVLANAGREASTVRVLPANLLRLYLWFDQPMRPRDVAQHLDLVVVEKFGELEQNGEGLIDEIFQTIAAGIPLLIAVPESALPLWQECSGELGSVLPFSEAAFEQWWQETANG